MFRIVVGIIDEIVENIVVMKAFGISIGVVV